MQVRTIFLSLSARNFDGQARWWADVLGRPHDREPMPTCREWDLADGVLFQVLDQPREARVDVSLRISGLDAEIARLRRAGVDIPDPVKVEGFGTLRLVQFSDPEGNRVNLLEGE